MTLATYDERAARPARLWWQEMRPLEIAEQVANTDFVKSGLRGNVPAIFACLMYGNEVGVGPMMSLNHISVIEGRPTMSAELQRALIEAAGHELDFRETNATRCVIAGRRAGSQRWTEVTWTIDDAKRANLAGRPNWQRYPAEMLAARASARLARLIFADVIGGLAATEELEGSPDDLAPTPAAAKPAAATTRRRRRTVEVVPDEPGPVLRPDEPGPTPDDTPNADEGEAGTPNQESPPPPMPDPEPAHINEPQRRKLMALYRERGIANRDERHAHAARVLGRPIDTQTGLTSVDASRLIEDLQAGLPEPVQQALDEAHPEEP